MWGRTDAERLGALDAVLHYLRAQNKNSLMSGVQLALQQLDIAHRKNQGECLFVKEREMVKIPGHVHYSAGAEGRFGKTPRLSHQVLSSGFVSFARRLTTEIHRLRMVITVYEN